MAIGVGVTPIHPYFTSCMNMANGNYCWPVAPLMVNDAA